AASFRECIWALAFPAFLLVGFRYGFFTATEAGAVVVVYALFVWIFIYLELTWHHFVEALQNSVVDVGLIMLIVSLAGVLGHALTIEQPRVAVSGFLHGFSDKPSITPTAVLALPVQIGMFMEGRVCVLLLTPHLLTPLVAQGFD